MSSSKKRSPIWQYFDLNRDDNKYVTCLLCQVQISRGGEGKKADTIHNKIKTNISKVIAVSVTSDMCNCLHNSSSFLSFAAHWLTSEFQLQHGVLAMKPFSGSHTGENIAKELNAIAARWDIEKNKLHLLIHDSSANMLVVNEAMKVQAEVLDMIATGRRLVTHFNHSGLAQEQLLAIQKELNLPQDQVASNRLSASSTPAKRVKEEETGSNFTREVHDTFWDCFNEVAKDNSSECRDQEKQNPIANEIDFFLKTPRINRNYDP
ncbi:zinc finger bed domain-containing protein 4 [Holotrichia oblita]|uniref:Zinc finger bed domain-containing protein 4 n=1 Tax=Holotrichia oblita TaxID=644536 RepID=A0ACB9SK54_HOLOL|nr:zinc finger bed domain-containing protein 4 [Holotrichia oblita]